MKSRCLQCGLIIQYIAWQNKDTYSIMKFFIDNVLSTKWTYQVCDLIKPTAWAKMQPIRDSIILHLSLSSPSCHNLKSSPTQQHFTVCEKKLPVGGKQCGNKFMLCCKCLFYHTCQHIFCLLNQLYNDMMRWYTGRGVLQIKRERMEREKNKTSDGVITIYTE